MVQDPVRQYLDAKKKLEDALSQFKNLSELIKNAASGLRSLPDVIRAADLQGPEEMVLGGGIHIAKNRWPTIQYMDETIRNLKMAHQAADRCYQQLSAEDQAGVVSPDKIVSSN
ncbi:MAG: hypothetical protein ABSB31_08930 [Dehalococcoidia bacterium]|jgi:hypothetical protein